jgi:hypothetical protein
MRSRIFNLDWEKFNHKDPEQRKQLAGALQYFLALPDTFVPKTPVDFTKIQAFMSQRKEINEARAQMFAGPADFPPSMLPIIEKYHIIPSWDNSFEQIFDIRDFGGSKRSGFTMYDVQSGLTFKKVKVGEKIDVYQMSGEKSECYFDYYGAGLGWHRQLFDDGDWWTIEDNAIEFRNKAYQFRASVFYALLEAAGNAKSACWPLQDPLCYDCTALAKADANSINAAAQAILLNTKDKGYGISPQTTFVVLTPIQLTQRIRQALGVTLQAYAGSDKQIAYNFQHISSLMLTSPTRYYVILPKYKLKGGYRMDLSLFSDFDILSYSDTEAGWMRYGGCAGDLDQIECIDGTVPSGLGYFYWM